jgi:hypothetical protein
MVGAGNDLFTDAVVMATRTVEHTHQADPPAWFASRGLPLPAAAMITRVTRRVRPGRRSR